MTAGKLNIIYNTSHEAYHVIGFQDHFVIENTNKKMNGKNEIIPLNNAALFCDDLIKEAGLELSKIAISDTKLEKLIFAQNGKEAISALRAYSPKISNLFEKYDITGKEYLN